MCKLKRRKSTTFRKADDLSDFPECRQEEAPAIHPATGQIAGVAPAELVTTTNAMMEITTKKVLLPLKDPNAAPVLGTLTRLKKSGTTLRAS